ncbi:MULTISPECIES: methionine ABC transporter ATP-binding protein [Paraliobacillus]|uniref:methionine ABC transporter ATP-binding protein n=1 Tax=Paraliobacillus TaxID=200903 RepID=UPI000DD2EBBB|nr:MULTISPECIES: ATP-binding cassette domain-containing protein [Paraliobacillus]
MISIQHLSKVYKTKSSTIQAVDDLSLNIDKGEIFGVIGYSGAGKSTFIRLINRLEEPSTGDIIIDNQKITSLSKNELRLSRQEIGMIFQHFNLLWSRTVRDNIALPLEIAGLSRQERYKRVDELIGLVGLTGREDAFPSQLSGGQKQRVGIARALANNPKVLLCDEATSALDPETTDSILSLLVDINQKLGLTIILITHEMHVIQKICHRVAVMEEGRIVEQGDVVEVFSHPKQGVTKKFVEQVMGKPDDEVTEETLIKSVTKGKVLRLHFVGETANQAVISQVAKRFDVEVNILHGNVKQTQAGAYGTLFVNVIGEEEVIEEALRFITSTSVEVEVKNNAN